MAPQRLNAVLRGAFATLALAIAAVGVARYLSGFLVGVPALDPVTFAGVGLLFVTVTVAASSVPAWRAAQVSPIEAMTPE